VDCSALEVDVLSCAGVPLVHVLDVVDTGALFARKVGWGQRRAGEGRVVEWLRVHHGHVRAGSGGNRQEDGGLGKHVDVVVESWVSREIARPAERKRMRQSALGSASRDDVWCKLQSE
jgi:hypothetical protein